MMKHYSLFTLLLATTVAQAEPVRIQSVGGWFESGYVTWTKQADTAYHVYFQSEKESTWTALDTELIREYDNYGRADIVGLATGQYRFRIVPTVNGNEVEADASTSEVFTASPYDRGGFAHFKTASATFVPTEGVGAYKNDGTLKPGAKVLYVTANNAKSITTSVQTGAKESNVTNCVGFQAIIDAYQKGYDKTPIDFRIVGTVRASDMDSFSSSAEGLQIKGNKAYSELNITIEGIGQDAVIHGFGFLIRNACSVELRNFAIMWCMDDAVSMDTDNSNLWVHNLDLFYGKPGGAADQKKGDGTLDIKGDSKYSTISYNHLWDSGKSSLCGMTGETGPNYLTYHHNWFDHSDSRHPRIRTMSVHIYNNYYDGNSKYGIGATTGSDVFAENNYFRACKYPMLISKQGSDVHNGVGSKDDTKGTFSGEDGGSIKAFGNLMTEQISFQPYVANHATYATHYDAYVVEDRNATVPEQVSSLQGNNTYSNFDTDNALMYSGYHVDAAADVPAIITGPLGAGRCQHGDFTWTFGPEEDTNDQVIASLSTAIQNYQPTLLGFFGQPLSNNNTENNDKTEDDNKHEDDTITYDGDLWFVTKGAAAGATHQVEISGNYSNSKGSVTYGEVTYTECLKMESATSIVITPAYSGTITLVFDAPNKKVKLDGQTYTTDANGCLSFTATAGTAYTVTKGDSINLYVIVLPSAPSGLAMDKAHNRSKSVKRAEQGFITIYHNGQHLDLSGKPIR